MEQTYWMQGLPIQSISDALSIVFPDDPNALCMAAYRCGFRDCFKALQSRFIALIPAFSQREKEEGIA
jgi:hypothetical protein